LVVPGGTSPGPVFDDLCGAEVAWDRVDVALSDERWVPETSNRSNTRLIKDRLLTGPAAAAHLVPLYADGDIEAELPKLAEGIDVLRPITVLLLGMGTDMHTASIFPEADNLNLALSPDAPNLVPMRAPGAPEPRVTLPAHVLDGAINKHILIFGDEKRAALERAEISDAFDAPIRAVMMGATVHWAQ
jgi:6-phosphogluconolactonase